MRLFWVTIVLALALCACRSSFYVTQGDVRLKEQNFAQAIANYDAALNSGTDFDDHYREEIAAKRSEAVAKYTDQLLAQIDTSVGGGQYDYAIQLLANVLAAGAFGIDAVKRRLHAALDVVIELRWERITADAAFHRYLNAIQSAEWLEQVAPDNPSLKEKTSRLRSEAREYHLKLAEGAQRESRLFHLQAVKRFGGGGHEGEIASLLVASNVHARPEYRIVIGEPTPGKECRPFIDNLKNLATQSSGGVPIVVRLSFQKCAHKEEHWIQKDIFTYPNWESYDENIEEQYYAREAEKCPEAACVRYDALGTCVERAKAENCDKSQVVLRTRQTPVTKYRSVTSTLSADVHHRRLATGVRAMLDLEWAGMKRQTLLDRVLALEEQEVWTPAQNYRFTTHNLESLASQVANEALSRLGQEISAFRPMLEQKRLEDAQKLQKEGRFLEAEAAMIAAYFARGQGSILSESHFGSTYGINSAQMWQLVNGQLARVAAAPQPFYVGSPDYPSSDERFIPVERGRTQRGARINEGGGLDIFARTETSPLDTAEWFESIGLRLRAEHIHLTVEGRTPALAGDSSGFSASMRGMIGERGYYFSTGIAWDHERADNGERRYFLGFPLAFIFPVGKVLTVEARVDLNGFQLKTLIDDDAKDPHFYSPISLRTEIDLGGRLYFSGVVRHYLGAGKDHLLDGGLELGVRL